MEFTDSLKTLFMDTARSLKGSTRRLFMARTVKELGPGGQRRAERELGWSRVTIRKGTHELDSGFTCLDAFAARGRKPVEAHLPTLLHDMKAIVDSQSQTDPRFRTTRLSTRLSAAEVRRQLSPRKGPVMPRSHGTDPNDQTQCPRVLSQEGRQESGAKKSPKPTPSSRR